MTRIDQCYLKFLRVKKKSQALMHDPVNYPKHYTSHPSGVEQIQISEHMSFNLGNVIKYVWRAGQKESAIQDLEKAQWYLQREINLLMRTHVNRKGGHGGRPDVGDRLQHETELGDDQDGGER